MIEGRNSKSPENVTGQSPQSSAESKDISSGPLQQSEPKAPDSTLPAAESAPAQSVAPSACERLTTKDQSEPEAAHRRWTQSEKYHFWLNVFLAVIGVIALFIYYWQLEEMRKSTDAATKAATAAEESIKLTKQALEVTKKDLIASNIPWVDVQNVSMQFDGQKEGVLSYKTENHSQTAAAFDVDVVWTIYSDSPTRFTDVPKAETGDVYMPGSIRLFSYPVRTEDAKKITDGSLKVQFWVTFADVFGKKYAYTLMTSYANPQFRIKRAQMFPE